MSFLNSRKAVSYTHLDVYKRQQIERMEIEKQLDILKIDFVSSDANFILIYSEINLFEELLPHDLSIEKIKEMNPKGIIFSGGPNSVYGLR